MIFTEEKDYNLKKNNDNTWILFLAIVCISIIFILSSCKTKESILYYQKKGFKVYKPVSDKNAYKKVIKKKYTCPW